MKNKSKYEKIGNLQLFKPDYISENKKTLLTSNIIKEYLRKRKGKYYYKVNFIKNKFNINKNEDNDIVNKRIHYKLIEDNYKIMKSEIYKRNLNLNGNDFEISKDLKLIDSNYNFLTKKIKSRNNETFRGTGNIFLSGHNIYDKYNKFKKTNSDAKMASINNKKELSTNFIDSNTNNNSIDKNMKKLSPLQNKFIIGYIKKSKIKELFKTNSPIETNSTERNGYKIINDNDITRENKKSFTNNNTIKNLPILNKNKKDKKFDDPFSLDDDPKAKLKMKYNFFRLENEDDMNLPINKFKRFQKKLYTSKKVIPNSKFHLDYVKYIIENIKRKEKAELSTSRNKKEKSSRILRMKKKFRNNNENLNNDNFNNIMFRSFNGNLL